MYMYTHTHMYISGLPELTSLSRHSSTRLCCSPACERAGSSAAIHHTLWVLELSCKGQSSPQRVHPIIGFTRIYLADSYRVV